MEQTVNQSERRGSSRFQIERDIIFKVLTRKCDAETGRGQTVDMSSTGVCFKTDHKLVPGRRLELSISWPAKLNDTCALKLVAQGRIARTESGMAAIEIQKYEFRTLGAGGFPA